MIAGADRQWKTNRADRCGEKGWEATLEKTEMQAEKINGGQIKKIVPVGRAVKANA